MAAPSSTSSSEPDGTLDLSGWRWGGLAWALAFVLLFDWTVARGDWVWTWTPGAGGDELSRLEREVLAQAPDVRVVALGSSRMRDGIAPRELEGALGLPSGSVVNLSLSGGSAFDALTAYLRNRERLRGADVALIGIDDWLVDASIPLSVADRRSGSLADRLALESPLEWPGVLLARGLRTIDVGRELRARLAWVGRDRELPPLSDDGRLLQPDVDRSPRTWPVENSVERIHSTFEPTAVRSEQLSRLLTVLAEDGVRAVLVQPPWRSRYVPLVQERYPDHWELYQSRLAWLRERHPDVSVVAFDGPRDAGLENTDLYDYGHLNVRGAARLAEALVPHLRPLLDE